MDINGLLSTVILLTSILVLFTRSDRAWIIKAGILLVILGIAWYFNPQQAGWIAAGPWVILYLLPTWLSHLSMHLISMRKMRAARGATAMLVCLHPWSGVKKLRQETLILDYLYQGELDRGLALVKQYQHSDGSMVYLAQVLQAQHTGMWAEFEERLQQFPREVRSDNSLLAGQLMATAHLGRWNDFADLCHEVSLLSHSSSQSVAPELRAWAYLGNISAIQLVLRVSGQFIAPEVREYWLAVAEQMGGQFAAGQERLVRLKPAASPTLLPMIERQLEQGPLPPPDREIRLRCEKALEPALKVITADSHFAVLTGPGSFPVMTLTLMLILSGVFLLELPGGSEDAQNLTKLGALIIPPLSEPREWTRMFTCSFLHVGPVHLCLNLLGLWVLGRAVEHGWGRWGVLLLFFASITVSGVLLPAFTWLAEDELALIAGASGGIMGLLGGLWGNLAVGWWTATTPRIRLQFQRVSSFIALQTVCDALVPGISMTCHLLGLVTGIVIGLCFGMVRCRRMRSG